MGLFDEGEEIVLDRPIEDSTGTLCQPGTYAVAEFEPSWYDRETGAGDSGWVLMFPASMTDEQATFFGDHFPERYTFDPGAILTASSQGREFLAEQERGEEAAAIAWAEEDARDAEEEAREASAA